MTSVGRPGGRDKFPAALLGIGVAVTLALFAVVAWSATTLRSAFRHIERVEMEVQRNVGVVIHLDEVLTMSARMAVVTGDLAWEKRYRAYEPKLDASIKTLIRLAPDSTDSAAAAQTDAANLKLVEMENRAFELVRAGDRAAAQRVVFSREYEEQKAIYAEGMAITNKGLMDDIDRQVERYQRRASTIMVFAGCAFLVLLVGWVVVYRAVRQHIRRRELAEREALESRGLAALREREMEIAARIQTSIVPRNPSISGLEVAAAMVPAVEVGGDYYEVLPADDGCWVAIGDVSGHGVTAGVIMLMVQSALAAAVRLDPDATPARLLGVVNATLFENLRNRLGNDDHVTLSLVRWHRDGRIEWAGAHEDIIVCRAGAAACDRLRTPGTWVGVVPDIAPVTVNSSSALRTGDLLVLYTDGITEAMNAGREQFGVERLCAAIAAKRELPVDGIRDHVLGLVRSWGARQLDDATILVIRQRATSAEAAA